MTDRNSLSLAAAVVSGKSHSPASVQELSDKSRKAILLTGRNPSEPLPDESEEYFCALVVSGMKLSEAYNAAFRNSYKPATIRKKASILGRRGDVAARITFLHEAEMARLSSMPGELDEKAGMLKLLKEAMRDPSATATDRREARKDYIKLMQWDRPSQEQERVKPDPAYIMQYFGEAEAEGVCPCCGQDLPAGMQADKIAGPQAEAPVLPLPVASDPPHVVGEGVERSPNIG